MLSHRDGSHAVTQRWLTCHTERLQRRAKDSGGSRWHGERGMANNAMRFSLLLRGPGSMPAGSSPRQVAAGGRGKDGAARGRGKWSSPRQAGAARGRGKKWSSPRQAAAGGRGKNGAAQGRGKNGWHEAMAGPTEWWRQDSRGPGCRRSLLGVLVSLTPLGLPPAAILAVEPPRHPGTYTGCSTRACGRTGVLFAEGLGLDSPPRGHPGEGLTDSSRDGEGGHGLGPAGPPCHREGRPGCRANCPGRGVRPASA